MRKNNSLKIISYNICALPYYINILGNPRKRIKGIINLINNLDADILCLQEVFDNNIRKCLIKEFNSKYNIYYKGRSYLYKVNSGLMTFSKFPIIYKKTIKFLNLSGEDFLSDKGVDYITIKLKKKGYPSKITVLNTHLNADAFFSLRYLCLSARIKQINQIIEYVKSIKNTIVLCGDFNTDFNVELLDKYFDIINSNKNSIHSKRLITFPEEKKQLDYIFYLSNKKIVINKKYKTYNTKTTDHKVLELLLSYDGT